MLVYHDHEWGVPVHDDQKLFEAIVLDAFQAGLSWQVVLNKRERFRKVFYDFMPDRVAQMRKPTVEKLLKDPGIIRNRMKIEAAIHNAKQFLAVQETFSSFDEYFWQFVDGKPIQNRWRTLKDIPAKTSLSDTISKDLKQRGFKFVGSTICYAMMQAVGMVNDHITSCYRHKQIKAMG